MHVARDTTNLREGGVFSANGTNFDQTTTIPVLNARLRAAGCFVV